jgi:hypothetical protein
LFRQGQIMDGLEVARTMEKASAPASLLSRMASELIDKEDFKDANLLVRDLSKDSNEIADDSQRINQLTDVALLEPQLGLYREARVTCPNFVFTELSCNAEILMQYKIHQDRKRFGDLDSHYDGRFHIDW